MVIISVDPGYDRLGIALVQKKDSQKEYVLYSECFQTSSRDVFNDRLFAIADRVGELIRQYNPEYLVIESLFFAKNTKTALKVSEARGAIIFQAKNHDVQVYEFTPNQIKLAVAGHGSANKDDVHFMTQKLVNLEDRKYIDDEIDAIAIGLTFFAHYRGGF